MKQMTEACGCCEGVEALTPLPMANRPGLNALHYRVGSHATFIETMLARLSTHYLEIPLDELDEQGKPKTARIYPLQGLKTRLREDPAIALLDAWATVADVLTFYQERIANQGYLRTATERRSILELARLVGYKLRPGVASSVYLAYTLDENFKDEVVIPTGARAQSVPGPGELPQSFETGEDLKARAKWNNLRPRMTQPQTAASITADSNGPRVYVKGINSNLKPNDPLLIDFGDGDPKFHRVKEVKPDAAADRTLVTLQPEQGTQALRPSAVLLATQDSLVTALTLPPSVQPPNSLRLARKLEEQFSTKAEAGYTTVSTFAPALRDTLATAAANAKVTSESGINVYALRVKALLFGHNHPGTPIYTRDDETGMITIQGFTSPTLNTLWPGMTNLQGLEKIAIEPQDEQVKPGDWAVIERPALRENNGIAGRTHSVHEVLDAQGVAMSALGFSAKVSLLTVNEPWLAELTDSEVRTLLASTPLLRQTIVYTRAEELELAEEPIEDPVCGGTDELIELNGFYDGLEAGRWVVVSGERDIPGTSGVKFSELAMLAAVVQDTQKQPVQTGGDDDEAAPLPGDNTHSFIKLAEKLQYCFVRDTVTIYGNMVKATHGETRKEVLGSGDGAKALQSFTLKQPPLTFVSAPNPSGVDSTLKVFVNDIEWHETDSLAGISSTDRNFIIKTDDDSKTTIIFGNGKDGARLPTGIENIKSEYRNGIGKPGNVKAGQISLLVTRPLGVKEVINPLRASGGADKEGRDQARKNAPLAVKALDRLVSVQDYEDFARTFAGIGKARAMELSDSRRQLIHVTIAGADDIPIEETSDLFRNLRQALLDFGDPFQPIQLAARELMLLVISARVRIMPDYQWEPVVTQLRETLLDAFSFERRELGQDVLLSEVISVMQRVRGVAYVDVDAFGSIPEKKAEAGERRLLTPEEISRQVQKLVEASKAEGRPESRLRVNQAALEEGTIRPAQLAFLTPAVPATLILNQIT
jgi:baseplate J-like protein